MAGDVGSRSTGTVGMEPAPGSKAGEVGEGTSVGTSISGVAGAGVSAGTWRT